MEQWITSNLEKSKEANKQPSRIENDVLYKRHFSLDSATFQKTYSSFKDFNKLSQEKIRNFQDIFGLFYVHSVHTLE